MQSRVAAIVITYNPDDITALLTSLSHQCDHVIVVDNASRSVETVQETCRAVGAECIALGENVGIAAAQNIGIEAARQAQATHVLLCDHDSLPYENMVEILVDALETDSSVGAVGPLASEKREGADQLVYVAREWKPGRASESELRADYVEAAFLIASGCLIRMECLDDVGLMNESLFIDHVDLEWGLRARAKNWGLRAIPAARMSHNLGDEAVLLPGRSQPVHIHSPIRNYYLARNTVWLIRQGGLAPRKWRVRYVWWLAKYAAFNGFFVDKRHERIARLTTGVRDGIRGRMGRASR